MINKISGKRSTAEVKHLQVSDKEITAVADIADTLSESFSEISSNKHYSSKFQSHKAHAERQTLKGLRGRLPLFIAGFLSDRKFQVRVGGSYSKPSVQETGIP